MSFCPSITPYFFKEKTSKTILTCTILMLLSLKSIVIAQDTYSTLNPNYNHLYEKYYLENGTSNGHLSFKPYLRSEIIENTTSNDSLVSKIYTNRSNNFNKAYLYEDNFDHSSIDTSNSIKPVFKHFYEKKNAFYYKKVKDFEVLLNPVLQFDYGKESNYQYNLFTNTRGVSLRGRIGNKVGFYTYFTENQAILPSYMRQQALTTHSLPGVGFWKSFKNGDAVDFTDARAYITFSPIKPIQIQFGHDRNFIGNGYRSLILSDYSNSYPFLKITTTVWKLRYTNLYTQLTTDVLADQQGVPFGTHHFPKKYFSIHHLSLNVTKNINIGVFESVMINRRDSTHVDGDVGFNYFNPVIFYRWAEQNEGSNDNAMMGLDFRVNTLRKISFYGQLTLDDLIFSEFKNRTGWWGNKYGIQLGGKYFGAFGLQNLDLQAEYNRVRPFTYSHTTKYVSHVNYNQPLAHPLGSNFEELILIARYQVLKKLYLKAQINLAKQGTNTLINYGADPLVSYDNRNGSHGIWQNQGNLVTSNFNSLTASYMVRYNLFLELWVKTRNLEFDTGNSIKTTYFGASLRLNVNKSDNNF